MSGPSGWSYCAGTFPTVTSNLVRYVGWTRTAPGASGKESVRRTPAPHPLSAARAVTGLAVRAKAIWARLIRKVYEADPLECPNAKDRCACCSASAAAASATSFREE